MKSNFNILGVRMNPCKTYIIVGHYGSGKTEFAVNYALYLKALGLRVAMADLDIVNPYFRVRQIHKELEKLGITVISNNMENNWKADLPALSRDIQTCFTDRTRENIVDVGGNGVGARVLSRFRDVHADENQELWMVVNARRYETQTVGQVLGFMRDIEQCSRMKITGFVNNTHMCGETLPEDVLEGEKMVRTLYSETGVPCRYTVCLSGLCPELAGLRLSGELLPTALQMRPRYL